MTSKTILTPVTMLNQGYYNVVELKGDNKLLLLVAYKGYTLSFIRRLDSDGRYCLVFSNNFVKDFGTKYIEYAKKLYSAIQEGWKLDKRGKFVTTEIEDIEFTGDYEPVGFCKTPGSVIPASFDSLKAFFVENNIDLSIFNPKLTKSGVQRDYSFLIASSPIAQEAFEINNNAIKGMVMPEKFIPLANSIKFGVFNLVYLVGPAGTGKSVLARQIANYMGAPVLSAQCSAGTSTDELIGCSDVRADFDKSESVIGSKYMEATSSSPYVIVVGVLLRAYMEGYVALLDEANFAVPSVLAIINQLTDGSPTFSFKGKMIKRHPNFVLFMTSNPGYAATELYNPATKTRGITIVLPKLTEDEFIARMLTQVPELTTEFYKSLFKFQSVIQSYADKWNEDTAVCIRHAINFSKLITTSRQTYEQFVFNFTLSYLNNALCMDNDNSQKINELLASPDFNSQLKSLYDKYPLKFIPVMVPEYTVEEAFKDFDAEWAEDEKESKSSSDSEIDDEDFINAFKEDDFGGDTK